MDKTEGTGMFSAKGQPVLEELLALNEMMRSINSSLQYDDVVARALAGIRQILQVDTVALFRVVGNGLALEQMTPTVDANALRAFADHCFGECLCGIAAETDRPVYSEDIHRDHRCVREECKEMGVVSFAGLPLRAGKRLFGIIAIGSAHPRDFSRHADFIEGIAQVVSLSLTNALNYEAACSEAAARKQAEEKLQESLANYRILIENQTDLVVKVDAAGCFEYVSPSYCAMFGKTEAELLGKSFMPLVHGGDQEITTTAMAELLSPPHTCLLEQRARTANGWRWLAWLDTAVLDEHGRVAGVIGVGRDISKRKAAEQSLEIFKKAVESASDAIGISSPEGRHYYQNPCFTKLFGNVGEDPPATLYADKTLGKDVFATIMRGDEWTGEVLMNAADGRILDIHLRAYAIKDERGAVVGLVGIHTDLTEVKNTQRALAEHQELLRSAFESIHDGISILNPDLTIRYTNAIMRKWYGHNLPLEGKRCHLCYHNATIPCDPCPTIRCMKTGKTERDVVPGLPGSKIEWVELFAYPIRDPVTGNISGVVEFVRNITDQKRAEANLKTETERLAVTLRSIGDAVITTDTTGHVMLMNRVAETLTGWSQQEAAGQALDHVLKLAHEISREPIPSPVQQVLQNGITVELSNHTTLIARDGSEYVIADSAAPIQNAVGKIIGVVLVFRDMTEKQRLLNATQKNQKLEALGVLAAGIAHDFNNLLAGVFGFVDMTIEEVKANDTAVELLRNAMDAMDRARSLTGQLLTFSKGGQPARKPGKLQMFVKETARFALSGTAVSKNLELPDTMWAVNYDRNQLGQVLDNILINARQAMPQGGTVLIQGANVELDHHPTLPAGPYVRLSITDCGIGIPAKFIQNIFDPFFTTKADGHGLGLASSYSIIQQHDGEIEVESCPGKGSSFHVYLPAIRDGFDGEATVTVPLPDAAGGRILIMDDERVIRKVLQQMLERLGYDVVATSDGQEALDQCRQTPGFHAMIVDLTVPGGMGGRKFLEAFRQTDTDTPVFVASGYASDPVLAAPTDYGFHGGLCKPFRLDELKSLLHAHLGGTASQP